MIVAYFSETPDTYVFIIHRLLVDGILNNLRVGAAADVIENAMRVFPEPFAHEFGDKFQEQSEQEFLGTLQMLTPAVNLFAIPHAEEWIVKLKAELRQGNNALQNSSELASEATQ